SIAWQTADERTVSGVYNSAYVGASSAIVAALFLSLIGFYLVTGSVRRDRERRVGAILAATPLSKAAYLGGKVAAHVVYLTTVAGVALAAGLMVFVRFGTGPLRLVDFLVPFALLVVPGMVFVAALAVLFDATPLLSGRGGLALFFFVWAFGLLVVPAELHGGLDRSRQTEGPALYDPIGIATFVQLLEESVPGMRPGGISIGLQVMDQPIERVEWPGVRWTAAGVLSRLATLAWAAVPFGLAVLLFDRFDPARRRRGARRRRRPAAAAPGELAAAGAAAAVEATAAASPALTAESLRTLPPVALHPTAWRAVRAEVRLLFLAAAPVVRWALLPAALLAAAPAGPGRAGTAALLFLLAPLLAETAARERLQGTGALVFSQPAVPLSPLLWKAAAAGTAVLALGLPRLLLTAATDPKRALAFLLGLAAVAIFAVGAGSLTGGGKLFTGLYVALWYVAVGSTGEGPGLDFSGAFAPEPRPQVAATFLAAATALLAAAYAVERRRLR
ncbi:MAG TPA: hypothetical protein VJG13_06705, partial [Thermoanaerobaculia bacterium]|nr:hypothetical protein [Thermoanaerobaculia bacterium]